MASESTGVAQAQTDKAGKLRAESDLDMLRILVDSIMEYSIVLLDTKGQVASWSPGAGRLTGYCAEEIVGKHLSVFYSREDATKGNPDRELETATREGRSEDESWRARKDGTKFWANVVITALRDTKASSRVSARSPAISLSGKKEKNGSKGRPRRSWKWPPFL